MLFKSPSRIFNPYGGVTIAIEELRECFGLCWSRSIGMFFVAHLLYRVSLPTRQANCTKTFNQALAGCNASRMSMTNNVTACMHVRILEIIQKSMEMTSRADSWKLNARLWTGGREKSLKAVSELNLYTLKISHVLRLLGLGFFNLVNYVLNGIKREKISDSMLPT